MGTPSRHTLLAGLRAGSLACLCAMASVPASAADAEGRYAVKGFGQVNCARFVGAREAGENTYLILGGWAEGYITGLNQTSPDTYDLTPFETTDLLMGLIDRHCRKHPEHRFSDVMRAMAKRLHEERIEAYTDLLAYRVGDQSGRIYRETVRRLQARLAELGHYAGPADGQYSPETVEAVQAFQEASGTTVTGLPDQLTLMRLFRVREQPEG